MGRRHGFSKKAYTPQIGPWLKKTLRILADCVSYGKRVKVHGENLCKSLAPLLFDSFSFTVFSVI